MDPQPRDDGVDVEHPLAFLRAHHRPGWRYVFALLAVGLGCALRAAIGDVLGSRLTYITFFPGVMLAASFCGIRPGLLATALSALVVAFWLLPPAGFAVSDPVDVAGLVVFVCVGSFMSVMAGLYHQASARLASYEQEQRARLQKLVEARTEELRNQKKSLKLHSTALEAAANGVAITNHNGTMEWVNPAFARMTGYSTDDLIGQNPRMLKSGRHSLAFYKGLWSTINSGRVWHGELVNRRKDGTQYTEEMTIAPVRDDSGTITHFIAIKQDVTARKRAAETAVLLSAIVESSDDAIIGKDLQGIITSWNTGAKKIFGYEASEMIGQSIKKLIPPERQAEEDEILALIARGESTRHFETVRMQKDGGLVEVSVTVSPIKSAAGKIIGASKVARDISEQKRIEEARRGNAERLRLATVAAALGIWKWEPVGDHMTWENDRPYEIIGIPQTNQPMTAARFAAEFCHPDDRPAFEHAMMKTVQTGARFFYQGRIHRPDGEQRWVEFTGSPQQAADGTCLSVIGTIQDITHRKEAEEALRKSEARERARREELEAVMDAIPAAVFIARDAACQQMTGNKTALTLLRISSGRNPSKSADESERPDYEVWSDGRQLVPEELPMQRAAATGKAVSGIEVEIVFPDGEKRDLLGSALPLFDDTGAVRGCVSVFMDIGALKAAEKEIRLLNKVLEQRVTERTEELRATVDALEKEIAERRRLEQEILMISEREQARLGQDLHDDLGQQLAGISMLANLLKGSLQKESNPLAEDAGNLMASLKHALQTTRSLAKTFFPVELDRGGLMMALEDLALRTEMLTKIHCCVTADANFWIEKDSAIHLYRIVQESIGNAVKHGQAENITIRCSVDDDVRTLTICDDGTGFKTPEEKDRWTGMGLHLLEYRARLIGAKVEVKPMADGKGCQVACLFAH